MVASDNSSSRDRETGHVGETGPRESSSRGSRPRSGGWQCANRAVFGFGILQNSDVNPTAPYPRPHARKRSGFRNSAYGMWQSMPPGCPLVADSTRDVPKPMPSGLCVTSEMLHSPLKGGGMRHLRCHTTLSRAILPAATLRSEQHPAVLIEKSGAWSLQGGGC